MQPTGDGQRFRNGKLAARHKLSLSFSLHQAIFAYGLDIFSIPRIGRNIGKGDISGCGREILQTGIPSKHRDFKREQQCEDKDQTQHPFHVVRAPSLEIYGFLFQQ